MAEPTVAPVLCPRCGTQHLIETWDVIDVEHYPHMRDVVFSGRIHLLTCSLCHTRTRIEIPFMYYDAVALFTAYYLPPDALSDPSALLAFDPHGRLQSPVTVRRSAIGGRQAVAPHVVFSITELVRYAEFREALARHRVSSRFLADAD